MRINQQVNMTHSDDEGFFSPVKQVVLRLNEFYATCSVTKMTLDAPAPSRLCSSEMTRMPYK